MKREDAKKYAELLDQVEKAESVIEVLEDMRTKTFNQGWQIGYGGDHHSTNGRRFNITGEEATEFVKSLTTKRTSRLNGLLKQLGEM